MDIQPLEVLKWVGVVLAAGFIGYFGRYLAMLIIEKIHKRRPQPTATAIVPITAAGNLIAGDAPANPSDISVVSRHAKHAVGSRLLIFKPTNPWARTFTCDLFVVILPPSAPREELPRPFGVR